MRRRGKADDETDEEADAGGDGDGGEVGPVVVGDEDDGGVGAEADERGLAEGELAGVADDEVEPQDGDGVGDDVVDLGDAEPLVEGEQGDRQGVGEHDVERGRGRR